MNSPCRKKRAGESESAGSARRSVQGLSPSHSINLPRTKISVHAFLALFIQPPKAIDQREEQIVQFVQHLLQKTCRMYA